jgi:hypothetical protein
VGHPRSASFCGALADQYVTAARASGHEVVLRRLQDLPVDLKAPDYDRALEAEATWVTNLQRDLTWCSHFVLVTPMWWGGAPASLKALFDRVLLPGFAFKYTSGPVPQKLLKGRSARVILTSDSPGVWYNWILGAPYFRQLRTQILEFVGFRPVGITLMSPIRGSSLDRRQAWLDQAFALGRKAG